MPQVTSVGFTVVPKNRLAFHAAHEQHRKAIIASARTYLDGFGAKWRMETDEAVSALIETGFTVASKCRTSGSCSVTPVNDHGAVYVVAALPEAPSASWQNISLPLEVILHVAQECPSFARDSGIWGSGIIDTLSRPTQRNPYRYI